MHSFVMKEGNITVLGEKTKFIGSLEFSDNLVITGNFKGDISSTGNLKIDKTGECEVSKISVDSALVAGKITGDIEVASKIEIVSGAVVKGDISAARLRIDDNVEFHGQVTMLETPPEVDIFSVTAEEYKLACLKQKN